MKNFDDIEKEKMKEKEKQLREGVGNLFGGILDDIEDTFKRKKIEKEIREKKRKRTLFEKITQKLFIFIISLVVINLILGNVWLLIFFIKSFLGFE